MSHVHQVLLRILSRLVISLVLGGVATNSIAEEGISYGRMDADFRSFYFDREREDLPVSRALTQALMLRYRSPYLKDVVSLNGSFFGNLKLIGKDGEGGTGLLQDELDGSQKSYAKLAEAFASFKLPLESRLDVGRMELIAPLLNDPDYRATPATSQAVSFRTAYKGVVGYLAGSNKGSAYTDPEFRSYTDDRGESFNIYTAGLEFEVANGLYLHGAFGQADNVMDQVYFNARYPWEINNRLGFLVDAYHYSGRANGEGALLEVGPDYRSSLSNIALRVIGDSSVLTLSLQTVNGDHYRTSWDGEINDHTSYFSWQSVQRLNFDRANEDSWQLRFDYDLKIMAPGLHIMARYISGDNIRRDDGSTGSEWERDIDFIYQPPGIRNLTLRWRNAMVRSTETFDSNENRLIVNYSIQAF